MTIKAAQAFILHARSDKTLQHQLAALKGAQALKDLCAIAEQHGYVFSEETYRQAVVLEAKGELDEEVLRDLVNEMGLAQQTPPQARPED